MRRSPTSTLDRRARLAGAALALLALAEAPSRFGEAVVVREADVLVEPPPRRGDFDDVRRWIILEDGLEREVVRVEPLTGRDAEPWDIVVWLDGDLVTPAQRLHAGAALSRLAPELAAHGGVALWSDGRETAARREPDGIATMLADVAVSPADRAVVVPDVPDLGALDRLLAFADRRSRAGPGVLVIPAAPTAVSPAAVPPRLDVVANVLAGYGWIVLVLPFRPPSGELAPSPDDRNDYQRWREEAAPYGVNFRGVRWPPRRRQVSVERTATQIDPALAVWRRFVGPSGGWVVDTEDQLRAAFDRLAERRRIWYRTSSPLDGSLRQVEARWRPTGQVTRAQAWRRAGTPEIVATARLAEWLARGGVVEGAAEVLARRAGREGLPEEPWRLSAPPEHGALRLAVSGEAPGTLRLRVVGTLPEAPATDRRARLSCIVERDTSGSEIRHSVVPWSAELELDCAAPRGVALEDLATGSWGALLLR